MRSDNKRIERLIIALEKHKDDRGVMADLKRGFSDSTADRTWPYLSKWGCDIVNDRERIIYQTVSAAYAVTKGCSTDKDNYNIGTVCRQLAIGDGRGDKKLKTFEARFRRLLTCSSVDEISGHLTGIIRAAAAKNIAINFKRLFKDLWYYSDNVKLEWASEYWKVEEP
ncbi:MAG: CRISPR-associated protein Cse2 [Candidatus Scalindua rubra]|uniref:CRISPR-associated protein Cse2 n=1 Tax=Candidatus Scalindua rubra TaxID=1872076 RepID=A0A1E3X6G3_9BACT|nr:MAG: CRISPR-associated protein Cse2 [Candidatus Scalindua rubra]